MNPDILSAIENQWEKAVPFFKKRGHVLFISDRYRFWEEPGFVQQSLAKTLIEAGVKVTWLDGMSWKPLNPTVSVRSPLLQVKQLGCLPGRRFSFLDSLSVSWQIKQIQSKLKDQPIIWIQGSLDERICESLPEIDIFSVFDDPYLHLEPKSLGEKAKIILNQNQFSNHLYAKKFSSKTTVLFPPMELNESTFTTNRETKIEWPHFSKPLLGYLGACFSQGFDFDLLEFFLQEKPSWNFLIVGRTDTSGLEKINHLKKYSNFIYHPHLSRDKLASVWPTLSLNLMLYKACRENAGAFPVKTLEAAYFNVPSIATKIPKTEGLENKIFCSSDRRELLEFAAKELSEQKSQKDLFDYLFYEMHPKMHLAKVAERLNQA
jgi:glycosyltransferase involved in cell wall biosynthesis